MAVVILAKLRSSIPKRRQFFVFLGSFLGLETAAIGSPSPCGNAEGFRCFFRYFRCFPRMQLRWKRTSVGRLPCVAKLQRMRRVGSLATCFCNMPAASCTMKAQRKPHQLEWTISCFHRASNPLQMSCWEETKAPWRLAGLSFSKS